MGMVVNQYNVYLVNLDPTVVMAYIVQGEILNDLFGLVSVPIDKKTMLPGNLFLTIFGGPVGPIYNHSMSSVISGMKKKGIK